MFARRVLVSLLAMLIATSVLGFIGKPLAKSFTSASALSMSSFYDIKEKDASGKVVDFSKFKGKVVYGVNVATKCGYTASGYALLAKIAKMKADGVEVAIFPCNQVLSVFIEYLVLTISFCMHMKLKFLQSMFFSVVWRTGGERYEIRVASEYVKSC